MAQFDVFRLSDGTLVVDCQSDLIDGYTTRLVAPLIEARSDMVTMPRLHPRFSVAGEDVIMVTQLATALRADDLHVRVGSLEQDRLRIIGAIDVLTGSG